MTEKETMSFARNDIMRAAEAALKAYDRGVEDGLRQEGERIREALLSDGAIGEVELMLDRFSWASGWHAKAVNAAEIFVSHIGLGAVTTEESEHER